ncbi:MAG: non-canonical purine NTP pyrophosphatase, partial [Actinomycetota bacterium]|nr:non-canonical purine NTP pyrophosphatase [Actinomycetota bacterium]
CRGRLADERRGSRGFGYDPAFLPVPDGSGRSMAELSESEKDRISHRGHAVRAFADWLARRGRGLRKG